jgi:hypothetical protein
VAGAINAKRTQRILEMLVAHDLLVIAVQMTLALVVHEVATAEQAEHDRVPAPVEVKDGVGAHRSGC